MSPIAKKQEELELHLREQVRFLMKSAEEFDAGDRAEAQRLAATMRVLVHDTAASHSLLDQLGVKSALQFHDSVAQPPPAPGVGAQMMGFVRWDLIGIGGTRFTPTLAAAVKKVAFSVWWDGWVLRYRPQGQPPADLTRRRVVLAMANKDGGSHVDSELAADYYALTRQRAFGELAINGEVVDWDANPVSCIVRQIAHELILTLQEAGVGGAR